MTKCRVCQKKIVQFFTLGKMPLVNAFLKKSDFSTEKKFDLSIGFCQTCFLVQLMHNVDPKELFNKYLYFSSVTDSIIDHSKKTADRLIKKLKLTKSSLVMEIGSNDGVHLRFYKQKGIGILGIDPAKNVALEANKKGIKTLPVFFNEKLAKKLVQKKIRADVVYGANVFAHIPTIVDTVKGLKIILKENGTLVFESPYIKGLLENKFDTIYHEHVFYYSLIALQNLFGQVDMEVYDIDFIPMQGGSLRIYVGNKNEHRVSKQVKDLESQEYKDKLDKLSTYMKMGKSVLLLKKDLQNLLKKLKKNKKKIVAYGAPAKGVILLNYFQLKHFIDYLVDRSPAKQGRYVPGVHILIENPQRIIEDKPDYVLILSWNIADEIINQLSRYKKSGGKFIVPIPQVKVL